MRGADASTDKICPAFPLVFSLWCRFQQHFLHVSHIHREHKKKKKKKIDFIEKY